MPTYLNVKTLCAAIVAVLCASALSPSVVDAADVTPIDFDAVGRRFAAGTFTFEAVETNAAGTSTENTETMCVDADSASVLAIFIVAGGAAGCEPESSHEDTTSVAATATCPATSSMAANFFSSSLSWSADGKQIDGQVRHVALEQGKPTDTTLKLIQIKMRHVSATCE